MASYQPRRTEQRRLVKHLLWQLQGRKCKICGKQCDENEGITEHADRDPANYAPENLGFVCLHCNQRKRPDYCQMATASTGKVEREKPEGYENINETETERNRQRARLKKSPIEIQINKEGEPKFRRYLWENVGRPGGLIKDDAIAEGAAIAGVNVQTTARWLAPAVSLAGPFRLYNPPGTDTEVIKLRDGYAPPDTTIGRLDLALMQERLAKADTAAAELAALRQRIEVAGVSLEQPLPICVMCSKPFVPFKGSGRTCAPCLLRGNEKGVGAKN